MKNTYGKNEVNSYLTVATKIANLAPGVGGRSGSNFKLGSVLLLGKYTKVGMNSYKTHPKLLPFFKYPFLHAEATVIIHTGLDNCKHGVLFVSRVLKNGSRALAKPCAACEELIRYVGIAECYFSIDDTEYGALK